MPSSRASVITKTLLPANETAKSEDTKRKMHMKEDYSDIINLPHHQSTRHPRMSMHDRAAQFAPFAALSGHSEAIEETELQSEKDNL